MLTCKEFLQELAEYLDGEVEGDLRRELESHVTGCPNCWVMVKTTEKTIEIYKGMEPQPIPPRLHARLMEALEKKRAAQGKPEA